MIQLDNSATEAELKTGDKSRRLDAPEPSIPPLDLQPGGEPDDAQSYRLDELLRYHDRKFVTRLYRALRNRPPTPIELVGAVDDLRSGRRTKIELIESLSTAQNDGQSATRVAGLSSPAWRRVSRWPIIGYLLRLVVSLTRLPVLIQDQQRFEAYALGQQQNIADYLNEVLTPAVKRHEEDSPVIANLSVTVADSLESVLMLSESLIELSARHEELQTRLQTELERIQTELAQQQAQQQAQQADLRADLQATWRLELERVEVELKRLQAELERGQAGQAQQVEAATRLETDLRALSEAHENERAERRQAIEETQRAQAATAAAQQDFLIQEQRVIVETQKVVLGELQRQLDQLIAEQRRQDAELTTQIRNLQALIGATTPRAAGRAGGKRVAPKSQQA